MPDSRQLGAGLVQQVVVQRFDWPDTPPLVSADKSPIPYRIAAAIRAAVGKG